jgi:Coenzyme PQQ synthesis protein D (PqqD)
LLPKRTESEQNGMNNQYPLARKDKLVVRELAEEVLAYDLVREKALCLNKLAGAVWKLSDGQKSVREIAENVSQQFGATVEEKVVWTAIDQLGRDHLLEYCISMPAKNSGVTRRKQLKSLGRAAAITGPLVAALTPPKASAAQSCIPQGTLCTPGGPPCCKGTCQRHGNGNAQYRCTGN